MAGLHVRRISSPPSAFQDPTRDRAFVAADPSLQDPGSNLTFTLFVNGFWSKSEQFTTRKMPISDQEFLTDPKSPLKKSYLQW